MSDLSLAVSLGPNAKTGGQSPGQSGGSKRVSRTPIIIIPAAPKSLISMLNAKDILQVQTINSPFFRLLQSC